MGNGQRTCTPEGAAELLGELRAAYRALGSAERAVVRDTLGTLPNGIEESKC